MDTRSAQDSAHVPVAYRAWYALFVLILIMMFNNLDRYVFAILIQPIKGELKFSDSRIGILTGFAFSAYYALFSIPVARLSDRGHRYKVIWMSVTVWSLMTALCGAAQNFWQMLFVRFGIGAGESGASPASQSMIVDLFPATRRNTALAIFVAGAAVGILLAFAVGARLERSIGWRWTFVVVGLPGLLLTTLFTLTVKDPKLGQYRDRVFDTGPETVDSKPPALLSNRIFINLCIGAGCMAFLQLGLTQWLPAFIERSFGIPRAQIGGMLASTNALGMLLGILAAGPLADYLARRDPLWPSRIILISSSLSLIPIASMMVVPDPKWLFVLAGFSGFLISMPAGLIYAVSQTVVAPRQRATAAAGIVIAYSFIGLGVCPLVVGILSDELNPSYGKDSLRWSLLVVIALVGPWMIFHFARLAVLLSRASHAHGTSFSAPAASI